MKWFCDSRYNFFLKCSQLCVHFHEYLEKVNSHVKLMISHIFFRLKFKKLLVERKI